MIYFDRVAKRYTNGREALTAVSLRITPGEMVFLTGRSGAGKSTVLKLIALLERPTRGQVIVNGENTGKLPNRKIPAFRRRIGVVFQDHRLLMDRPVFDNVALPLLIADEPTGNLDPVLAGEVMSLFKRLNEVGVTILVATHDVHFVRESGLREIVLEGGVVAGSEESLPLPPLQAHR